MEGRNEKDAQLQGRGDGDNGCVAGGCGNLIADWLRRGMDTPPEELADVLGWLSAAILRHLEEVQR